MWVEQNLDVYTDTQCPINALEHVLLRFVNSKLALLELNHMIIRKYDKILFSNRNLEENGPSFCPMWVNDSVIEWRISRVYNIHTLPSYLAVITFSFSQYFVNYKLGLSYTGMESSFVPFFLQYLALSAQLPNVIFNWINVFFKLRY